VLESQDGAQSRYRIVGPTSSTAPRLHQHGLALGRALLRKTRDEEVIVEAPAAAACM